MKWLLTFLFFWFSLFWLFNVSVKSQSNSFTILHVNDTHSCIAPLGPRNSDHSGTRGGIARAATVIGQTRATEENVIVLHGGDAFVGDLVFNSTFGVAELALMEQLGFDAMAVGNHEFDLGPEVLQGVLGTAFSNGGFPLVSSNLVYADPSVEGLAEFIKPFVIKEYSGFKVGIFGLTTPETNIFSIPSPVVVDTGLVPIVINMIGSLKEAGCDVVILLSHLGLYYDKMLASAIPGIDIILSAHDHFQTDIPIEISNPYGGRTWIVEQNAFYNSMGKMKVDISPAGVTLISYESIELDEEIPENEDVFGIVQGVIRNVESHYGPVYTNRIGFLHETLDEEANVAGGRIETGVGKLVTDAFRWKTGTDIAIQVGGSTAQPLYKGKILSADIFRMLGYGYNTVDGLGYRIATFRMKGEWLWMGLEIGLSQAELNDELVPQVSGMKYYCDISQNPGSRVTYVEVNGEMIDPEKYYTVTANEFFVAAAEFLGIQIADLQLLESITEYQTIVDYIINGGITGIDENLPVAIPSEFRLEQNYPNPFNPSTVISYRIPSSSYVTLKVFNLLGQEVSTLVNQNQSAGTYKVEWNASGLSSGIYFYRLEAENFVEIKKMIFAK